MTNGDDEQERELPEAGVPESPATWENVAVGKAKELLGEAVGNDNLAEEGEEQVEIAHEVREKYQREHPH